jgi:NADPH-dependent glutamate synthase beta subunit-like oxidoreductase/glutamate synthase domain-containing protein 3/Pyruvate/2-oxoacid:ferredoxin oxidoreductase delta subunit
MEKTRTELRIKVGTTHYRELGDVIRRKISEGVDHFILEDVIGQRYIGAGLDHGINIEIRGVPGQDLGVFNGGAQLVVYGNAQDGVGNTMNGGHIIVHGSVGDIPGHMIRNGKIYIRGSAGFRAGIMMKEYGSKHPVMIIGESIGDYVGEYMAGGTIIVLGYSLPIGISPVSQHVASGMFGGKIYVRGPISQNQLGKGAVMHPATPEEIDIIKPFLEEYAGIFDLDLEKILDAPVTAIRREGGRPYGNLYVPSSKITRELKPVHRNIVPPCAHACAVGIPNPIIIKKLRDGATQEAFDIIDDYTPFRYSCCGMVCPGLCRAACSRNMLDEPVAIDAISRKYHPTGRVKILEPPKQEHIGIIGAGPSGLSAAWHLARRGYAVTVYEKERDIGGKLMHNIPEERLPREEVLKDLNRIRSLGIRFVTGRAVDAKLFGQLRDSCTALILAVGAQRPKSVGFTGEERAISSFHFLRSTRMGGWDQDMQKKSVVIIGAGNVAMDAASECFRLGAKEVTTVDIQKPAAFGPELDRAMDRGVSILFPRRIESFEDGIVKLNTTEELKADLLIESIGELPELEFVGEKFIADSNSFITNIPGLYIIGDALVPGLVTHSIGMGKKAALFIYSVLSGIPLAEESQPVVDKRRINPAYFEEKEALFNSLDTCFSCGTCIQCDICIEHCPRGAVERVGEHFSIHYELCSGCGVCASVCPRGAITMETKIDKQE